MASQNPERHDLRPVLVLGLGNTLLTDEGLGIHALRELEGRCCWPESVAFMDGGVMGLDLLPYLEEAACVLVIDAIRAGYQPGTLVRIEGDDVPTAIGLKMSVHQIGLQETLAMARLRGTFPARLVLWGMEPESLALGMALSPSVAGGLSDLVQSIVAELADWGIAGTLGGARQGGGGV